MAGETDFPVRVAAAAFPGNASALLNRLNDKEPPRPVAAAETLKYEVELITPLFGGGVKPGENDPEHPVRMKALRGQLRFWWRMLAAYGAFQDYGLSALTNGSVLYEEETARWGGAGENGYPVPGRIGLHVHVPNVCGFSNAVKFEERNPGTGKYHTARPFYDVSRSIEYALFPAKHGAKDNSDAKKLILPGNSFTLAITVNADGKLDASQIAQELRCTLVWWATFGGIGARWRRGVGSIRVRDENNTLLCVLDDNPTNASCLPGWADASGTQLKTRSDCNAMEAWAESLKHLRLFRQDPAPGIGREGSLEHRNYGQSFWPEPHLARHHHDPAKKWAHKIEPQFVDSGAAAFVARGALGLPLEIKFPEKVVNWGKEPPSTKFLPEGFERMASPLILRAVARRNGNFTPCALLLPWWRDALSVPLVADPKDGPGASATGYRVWPDDPAARGAAAAKIRPIDANQPAGTPDPDPLSAFMEFFSK